MSPVQREELERQIAGISRDAPAPRLASPAPIREPETFGAWLLVQRDRGDWIDDLATAARADRDFPKRGNPDEVRGRLRILGADGDAFEQLDDAERMWRAQ